MDLVLMIFIVLVVSIGVIAVVGHGLWLLLAAMFRNMSGQPLAPSEVGQPCRCCGRPRPTAATFCPSCKVPYSFDAHDLHTSDALATARQLKRLLHQGVIDREQHNDLLVPLREQYAQHVGQPVQQFPQVLHPVPIATPPPEVTAVPDVAPPVVMRPVVPPPPAAPPLAPVADKAYVPPADGEQPIDAEVLEDTAAMRPHEARVRSDEKATARRSFADLLAGFMEQKNIRWGEVISGILIVGSAIGLVVSLRTTLEDIPYFSAMLFLAITAAIYGAGIYTLKRWNLQTTSRGVLVIVLLLVPLNFLTALVGPNERPTTDPLYLLAVAIGIVVFGAISFSSSLALDKAGWWRIWLAVMGASAGQLLIDRILPGRDAATAANTVQIAALVMALPLASFLIAVTWAIREAQRADMTADAAEGLYLLLGVAAFAFACAVGLFLTNSDDKVEALTNLSPVAGLAASAVLSAGLLVHRRGEGQISAAMRLSGTAVAIFGALLMLAALLFASARPILMATVAVAEGLLLGVLAVMADLAVLHFAAIGCATLAALTGVHWMSGWLDVYPKHSRLWIWEMLWSDRSSLLLVACSAIVAGGGVAFQRLKRAADAACWFYSSAALGLISLLIAVGVGFFDGPDAPLATWVFAIYAVAGLTIGVLGRQATVVRAGSALLLLTLVHGIVYSGYVQWDRPWLLAFLIHGSTVVSLAGVAAIGRQRGSQDSTGGSFEMCAALAQTALASSAAAMLLALWVGGDSIAAHAGFLAWVALILLAAAVTLRSAVVFAAFQFAATACLSYFTAAACQTDGAYGDWLFRIRHVQWQITALGAVGLAWTGIEWRLRRRAATARLLLEPVAFRYVLHGFALAALVLMAIVAVKPGVFSELGISNAGVVFSPFNFGSWMAWIVVTLASAALLFEKRTELRLTAQVLVTAVAPLVLAVHFESSYSVATAARWAFGVWSFAAALKVVWLFPQADRLKLVGRFLPSPIDVPLLTRISNVCLLLGGLPVYFLSIWAFGCAMADVSPHGPLPDSFFGGIGSLAGFAIPLAMVVAALTLHAVACRQQWYLTIGSIALQAAVSMACSLSKHLSQQDFDAEFLVRLLQWNAIALAGFALLWLVLLQFVWREDADRSLIAGQIGVVAAVLSLFAIWIGVRFFFRPDDVGRVIVALGGWPSYLAAAATGAVFAIGSRLRGSSEYRLLLFSCVLPSLLAIVAATATRWDVAKPPAWIGYHVFVGGLLFAATVLTGILVRSGKASRQSSLYVAALTLAAAVFSLRAAFGDPQTPWWPAGGLVWSALVFVALAIARRKQDYAFASTLLPAVAAAIGVLELSPQSGNARFLQMYYWVLLVVTIVAAFWSAVEIWWQRKRDEPLDPTFKLPNVGRLGIGFALIGGGVIVTLSRLVNPPEVACQPVTFVLLGVLAAALFVSLWDRTTRFSLAALYVCGGLMAFAILGRLELEFSDFTFALATAAACYSLFVAWLWNRRVGFAMLAQLWTVPNVKWRVAAVGRWLPIVTLLVAAAVVTFDGCGVLVFHQRQMRVGCGFGPAIFALAFGLLTDRKKESGLRPLALVLFVLAATLLTWAEMQPRFDTTAWLLRLIRLVVVAAGMSFVYGFAGARRLPPESIWRAPLWKATILCMITAAGVLLAVLPLEGLLFEEQTGLPIDAYHIGAVSFALAGVVVTLLTFAVAKGRDPLDLSEHGKMAYVYAAEFFGLLLFVHIYLAAPWIFRDFLRPYWPFIVMAIAFVGAGFSEIARRAGSRVLSEPLYHTGALLPLLPALGVWVIATEANYSLVMFTVGLLYVMLSVMRNSVTSALAAALAGNVALWSLLHDHGWTLLVHPQFWLIPPAVSVLIAAQVNRDRLGESQLSAIRYVCMLVIYLSSTAEMFIRGIGETLWPPMILASLAVAGAFAGMALRIRAFLYTGSCFVLFAVVSMVWHAYERLEHMAIWWAFGITLGVAILALFAVLEKKRDSIHAWTEQLRQWER